jgi:F-type H+-transporting ATPase subunit b
MSARLAAPLFMAVLLVASDAAAAEGSQTFLGLPRVVWYSLNLIVFFGFLAFLLAKPLSRFFRTRSEEIASQLAEAQRQREEAERLRREVEGRVASLQEEIRSLRERLLREGENERDALRRQGEEEAARLLLQVDQEATRRVGEARRQLTQEAAAIAAELARELIEREMAPEDRDRIFAAAVERLRAQHRGGGA